MSVQPKLPAVSRAPRVMGRGAVLRATVTRAVCEPYITSTLEVRANGVTHRVTWDHCLEGLLDEPMFRVEASKDQVLRRLCRLGPPLARPFTQQKNVMRLRQAEYICL